MCVRGTTDPIHLVEMDIQANSESSFLLFGALVVATTPYFFVVVGLPANDFQV